MPYRVTPFVAGEIYHVFNCSIARQPIFTNSFDYERFLQLITYYKFGKLPLRFSYYKRLPKELKEQFTETYLLNSNPSINLYAYCLMPNHFHFLLSPTTDTALSDFMSNIQNGYSKYFNLKYERSGSLFQAMFKAVRIETDEQLIHVSRYIHLNPTTAYLVQKTKLREYQWSSLQEYLTDDKENNLVDAAKVLSMFKTKNDYKNFVYNQIDYQRELAKIKHLVFN